MRLISSAFLICFGLLGCVSPPEMREARVFSVGFPANLLDPKVEEAVEQVELVASNASIYLGKKPPDDWGAGVKTDGNKSTCTFSCEHSHFSISDVRNLNNILFLRTSVANLEDLELTARIFITRGPAGHGRFIDLPGNRILLKPQPRGSANGAERRR